MLLEAMEVVTALYSTVQYLGTYIKGVRCTLTSGPVLRLGITILIELPLQFMEIFIFHLVAVVASRYSREIHVHVIRYLCLIMTHMSF